MDNDSLSGLGASSSSTIWVSSGMIYAVATTRFAREVAGIIAGRMKRFGVTQSEMAYTLGISQSQVSKFFRGVAVMDIDQLELMCWALELDVEDVVDQAVRDAAEYEDRDYDLPRWVVMGEHVSTPVDDEPSPLSVNEERELRQSKTGLAAKRGDRRSDQ